jgi:predicted secreted protein
MNKFLFLFFAVMFCFDCKTNTKISSGEAKLSDSIETSLYIKSLENETKDSAEILFDTLNVELTDTFNIDLAAAFTTGKMWNIIKQDSSIALISKNIFRTNNSNNNTDIQRFTFIALKSGNYNIQFVNKRPFGKEIGTTIFLNNSVIVK